MMEGVCPVVTRAHYTEGSRVTVVLGPHGATSRTFFQNMFLFYSRSDSFYRVVSLNYIRGSNLQFKNTLKIDGWRAFSLVIPLKVYLFYLVVVATCVARLVTTSNLVGPHVVLCHSDFQGQFYLFPLPL